MHKTPLSIDDWVNILKWSAPILILDEILKAIGRKVNAEKKEARKVELATTQP